MTIVLGNEMPSKEQANDEPRVMTLKGNCYKRFTFVYLPMMEIAFSKLSENIDFNIIIYF